MARMGIWRVHRYACALGVVVAIACAGLAEPSAVQANLPECLDGTQAVDCQIDRAIELMCAPVTSSELNAPNVDPCAAAQYCRPTADVSLVTNCVARIKQIADQLLDCSGDVCDAITMLCSGDCADTVLAAAGGIIRTITDGCNERISTPECVAVVEDKIDYIFSSITLPQDGPCTTPTGCRVWLENALASAPCYPADETVGCALIPVAVIFIVVGLVPSEPSEVSPDSLDGCREDVEDVPCIRDLDDGSTLSVGDISLTNRWAMTGKPAPAFDNIYPTEAKDANGVKYMNYKCFDDDGSNRVYCQTDNRDLTFHVEQSAKNQNTNAEASIRLAMFGSYDETVLTVSEQAPVRTGTSETDIMFQGNIEIAGFAGVAWCDDANAERRCDQHYVQFAKGNIIGRSLACHEAGHAVGLTHGEDAYPKKDNNFAALECMKSAGTDYLGSHNVNTIDRLYGN